MKSKSNRFLALASLTAAFVTLSASAATYQWDGSDSSDWTVAANWVPTSTYNGQSITAGPAPSDTTAAHRLNVNNQAANELIYSSSQGTTNFGGASIRGLVIGSGAAPEGGSGTMTITGGTFSSLNASGNNSADIIGNGDGNIATLNISGGHFIGASTGTSMNLGGGDTSGRVSNLTVSGTGTATLTSLILNGVTINVNLDGGTLELNGVTNTSIALAGKIRLNGGTLKARQTNAGFIAANANLETLVQSGGAVIDTNGFDITIAEPLLEDAGDPDGGLIKNGGGLLTLGALPTTTGATVINAGGLSVKGGTSDSWYPDSFTHSGDKLNFNLGDVSLLATPVIDTTTGTGTVTFNTAIQVNVTGTNFEVGQIPLINYTPGNLTGFNNLTLNSATLPPGVLATLEDDGNGQIYLDVTQVASLFTWSKGDGDWDTSALNWNADSAAYAEPAIVTFPDLAEAVNGVNEVNVTANRSPLSVTINNTGDFDTNAYSFSGAGGISGTTGIAKSGAGIVTFTNGTNDYSGVTTISAGAIVKQAADSTTGNISVANGATLVLDGGITDGVGQTITITGPGATGLTAVDYFYTGSVGSRGALQAQNGDNTWAGDIVVIDNGDSRIGVQNGASLTLTGNISGAVPRFRAGGVGEDITLSGVGSWTGDTVMFSTGGSIKLGGNDRLPVGTRIFFTGSQTVFDLNGHNQQVAGMVSFNPTVTNNGASPSVLTLSPPTGANHAFYGYINDGTDVISVVKSGDGTNSLEGNNTYSGTTTVNSGTLLINSPGVLSAASDVTVNGGILGGTGTINGPITVGALGTLAPGVTTGVLHVYSVDLSSGGTLAIDMNDAAAVKTDWLDATDTIDVTNAKLVINVTGALAETSYLLASASSITGTIDLGDVTGLPAGYTLVQDGFEIRLDQATGSAYETWGTPYGLTAGSEGGDLDNDGLTNFEEFAFGLIPNDGSSVNPITVQLNKTAGTFTYQRLNGSGLTYTIWTSTDLVTWNEDTTADQDVTTGSPNDSVVVTLTGAPLTATKLFVRVKAE